MNYKKGAENSNADTLSRLPKANIVETDENVAVLFESTPVELEMVEVIRRNQCQDDELSSIITKARENNGRHNNYFLENDILFCKRKGRKSYDPETVKRLVVPKSLRKEELEMCHDGICGAHLGNKKTWWKVSSKFYWPSVYEDTENWVNSCENCAARKTPQKKTRF